jgi:MFS family permease
VLVVNRSKLSGASVAAVFAAAGVVAPLRSSAAAQFDLDGSNLLGVLAPLAGALTCAVIVALHTRKPASLSALLQTRLLAGGLLIIGAVIAGAAPVLIVQLIGTLVAGVGLGVIAVQVKPFALVTGLAIGPLAGGLASAAGWRAQFAVSVLAGLLWMLFGTTASRFDEVQSDQALRPLEVDSKLARPAALISGAAICALIVSYASWARYDELLRPSQIATQTGVVLTVGALLGLWRGRALDRRGVGRRAVRHGMWCVLIGGGLVGSFFDFLPAPVRALLPVLVSFGLVKIATASSRSTTAVSVGAALGAIVATVVGVSGTLSGAVTALEKTAPESVALSAVRSAQQSLPRAMNISRDPRTGEAAAIIRASVRTQVGGQLALGHFIAMLLVVVCCVASFVLPRHYSIANRRALRLTPIPPTTLAGTV